MHCVTTRLAASLLALSTLLATSLPVMARPATLSTQDTNGRVNLRSGASIKSRVLEELKQGGDVEVLNIFKGSDGAYWYYVQSAIEGTEAGWVRSDFVRFKSSKQQYGTLKGKRDDKINVRSAPSRKGNILHYGLAGDLVVIERSMQGDEGYRWHYVTFPSQASGWVREDLLSVWPPGCIITCANI
jgi:uncharacterized protein YgiM (DUF1202 family)